MVGRENLSMMGFLFRVFQTLENLPRITWVFLIFVVYAISRAIYFRWVCDDAFISFRYAKNLVDGFGLVFNSGEYVEGYSNFLWTLGIALGMWIKIDPLRWVQFWGLVCYLVSICFLFFLSFQQHKNRDKTLSHFFPLAALCVSIQTHAQIYATGGLETSCFGMFLILGYGILLLKSEHRFILLGNFFLILASLTRPEGILFAIWGVLFIIFFRLQNLPSHIVQSRIFFTIFPLLAIYIPYFFWRLEYYGKIFPNTYYAKYGHGSYYEQGIKYILLYLNSYYVFYSIIFFFFIFFLKFLFYFSRTQKEKNFRLRRLSSSSYKDYLKEQDTIKQEKSRGISQTTETLILLFIPALLYTIYLVKIGGDFMFARLLISLSPILFYCLEVLWLEVIPVKWRLGVGIGILLATFFWYNPYRGLKFPIIENISSENEIYKLKEIYKIKNALLPLQKIVKEAGLHIAFGGAQAMFAYYLNPKVAIETASGLTDSYIANQKVKVRGKVGHEKKVSLNYLRKRKVHIHLDLDAVPKTNYNGIKIHNLPYEFRIVVYESKVFQVLKESGKFSFIPFEDYLDKYLADIKNIKIDKLRRDYFRFQKYYFFWNEDKQRESFFQSEKKP